MSTDDRANNKNYHLNEARMNSKKIIEKLEFTDSEKADILKMLNRGSRKNISVIVREKYNIGTCLKCGNLPTYKIIYKLPDCSLLEYYCKEHFEK